MLGIRLPEDKEQELARHARATGRGKSVIAREWILERLERESVDAEMRRAAQILAKNDHPEDVAWQNAMTDDFLAMLDEEDGGYDWGEKGPPV
jgi:predicted DNA-binding protein